jgi:hypothetical protein
VQNNNNARSGFTLLKKKWDDFATAKRQRDGFGAFRKETGCHSASSHPTSSTAYITALILIKTLMNVEEYLLFFLVIMQNMKITKNSHPLLVKVLLTIYCVSASPTHIMLTNKPGIRRKHNKKINKNMLHTPSPTHFPLIIHCMCICV